jgi:thiamine kinase-like enzyme
MPLPPHLLSGFPTLEAAFDEAAMRERLQAAVFGGAGGRWTLERCEPDRPLVVPGEGCTLQYECRVRDAAAGELYDPIVIGRVFADGASAADYWRRKLAPLVQRVEKRADLATFACPAAAIEPLHMLVHVWPLDGELPRLIDATDPRNMSRLLGALLNPRMTIERCQVDRVSYRRRSRCVLRYTLTGRATGGATAPQRVVYGKLTPRGDTALYGDTLPRLRAHFERRRDGERITIPRSLGWRPELGLALLEEVPGEAKVGSALRAKLKGKAKDGPALEELLSRCVRVAVGLHGSGLRLGRPRTFEDRLADLANEVGITREFSPEFADEAAGWLERVTAHASASAAQPAKLCHGDFKYAQVFFAGDGVGLVDLDNVCQAEPALDLGQFCAYLRTQARKNERADGVPATLENELCDRFLDEYAVMMALSAENTVRLRVRATLHEVASLLRMALHSQQKLKASRLDSTRALIEERLGTLG